MPHDLVDRDEFYENRRENLDNLDDVLDSAWDQGQEKANEDQIADDLLAGEHDRAGTTSDQRFEIAYDAGVIRKGRAQARAEAAAGNAPDRPPAKVTKKAADNAAYEAHLSREWDKRAGVPAQPAEETPEAAQPQQTDGISAEDRAALAKAPPETRAVIDRHIAGHRETYGAVDQLAGKWSGYLAERGAATPADQVGVLDNLLQTERALATGTPEQKIAIMRQIAHDYGVGAPSGGPAPQAHPQAPPAPQQSRTGNPEHDRLVDQLGRDEHSQQLDAWRQAMATAGPESAATAGRPPGGPACRSNRIRDQGGRHAASALLRRGRARDGGGDRDGAPRGPTAEPRGDLRPSSRLAPGHSRTQDRKCACGDPQFRL